MDNYQAVLEFFENKLKKEEKIISWQPKHSNFSGMGSVLNWAHSFSLSQNAGEVFLSFRLNT